MKKNKNLHSPIVTMLNIIFMVSLATFILSILKVDGTKVTISNGIIESSIVVVKNVFSKEGIIDLFSNTLSNFNLVEPFISILIGLSSISLLKYSGFLKHIFTPLKKLENKYITFIVVLLGVISSVIGDYSFAILLPLVCVLYEYVDRSPVLGIITVFLGITLGYGTSIFYSYNDYALGVLTQMAAVVDVDSTYQFNLNSYFYIMGISTFIISFLITILIEKNLSKKIKLSEKYDDKLRKSKKGMLISIIAFLLLLIPFVISILPNGILLDNTQPRYVAKLFSPTSPFNISFMLIFLMFSSLISLAYGFVSRNFKSNYEFTWAFTKELNDLGYLFILLLLSSILLRIINWSNIGIVIAGKLISILSLFDFTGIMLIFISFVFIVLISFFIPGSLEKWALISPILVPLFMKGNLTPDFAQFVFKSADSVGKIITPIFIYWIVMVGFIQKYNKNQNEITFTSTLKIMWPVIVTCIVFWILILILWYVAGLPLGINTLVTM